jgi:SAM-dependent methyltransferase
MSSINNLVQAYSLRCREGRAAHFRKSFKINASTVILDLGSEDGSHIHGVLGPADYNPSNVYIADIDPGALERGERSYGFSSVLIHESKPLPFPDSFFDIVFCSSVIEHVTVPKDVIWSNMDGHDFRTRAMARQRLFAMEIRRLGRQYYVQTPHRMFPVESHSWLPFLSYLPRRLQVPLLRISNRFWVKKTSPDWNLLNANDISSLFPDARIAFEMSMCLRKSIIAIRASA